MSGWCCPSNPSGREPCRPRTSALCRLAASQWPSRPPSSAAPWPVLSSARLSSVRLFSVLVFFGSAVVVSGAVIFGSVVVALRDRVQRETCEGCAERRGILELFVAPLWEMGQRHYSVTRSTATQLRRTFRRRRAEVEDSTISEKAKGAVHVALGDVEVQASAMSTVPMSSRNEAPASSPSGGARRIPKAGWPR